jgi:hypothetical protein
MQCHWPIGFATCLSARISTPLCSHAAHSPDLVDTENPSAIHPPAAAAIAERYEGDGATANVFGHCTLQEEEVHALYVAE